MYAHARKRIVSVTLDIECYEDLDLQSYDWNEVLGLEGDENVQVSMEELVNNYQCVSLQIGTLKLVSCANRTSVTWFWHRPENRVLLFLWVENVTYFPTNSFHK